jgi:predicted metal-dependent enzyme (double-stranded beta helix superfamily)
MYEPIVVSAGVGFEGTSPIVDWKNWGRLSLAARERAAVETFAARVNALGDLHHASSATRLRVLEMVREIATVIDISSCIASPRSYGRRVLLDDPSGWNLSAITLRNGQETEAHDHDGWGCVATAQGIERDRRYRLDEACNLLLISERDYPVRGGYVFDFFDIHQPAGADPRRLTVALHFLVHRHAIAQRRHEHRTGRK